MVRYSAGLVDSGVAGSAKIAWLEEGRNGREGKLVDSNVIPHRFHFRTHYHSGTHDCLTGTSDPLFVGVA